MPLALRAALAAVCDSACQAAQRQALVTLYEATGGQAWFRSSFVDYQTGQLVNGTTWLLGESHCSWFGEPWGAQTARSSGSLETSVAQVSSAARPRGS